MKRLTNFLKKRKRRLIRAHKIALKMNYLLDKAKEISYLVSKELKEKKNNAKTID